MASLTHEERIISRCRDIYSGRNVTPEWAAKTCGISLEEFEDFYNQYIQRLCYAIQHKQEWFLLHELEYLLQNYMRSEEAAKRFRVPKEKIEQWVQENKNGENANWRDVRILQVEQKEQEKTDGEN